MKTLVGFNSVTLVGRIHRLLTPSLPHTPVDIFLDTPRTAQYADGMHRMVRDRHIIRIHPPRTRWFSQENHGFIPGVWVMVDGTLRYERRVWDDVNSSYIAVIRPMNLVILKKPVEDDATDVLNHSRVFSIDSSEDPTATEDIGEATDPHHVLPKR